MKALQPEPVPEVKEKPKAFPQPKSDAAPRREKKVVRKPRRKGDEDNTALIESINEPPAENEPTFMEIAMREAMEKAKDRKKKADDRKTKAVSKEQEELLSRTLENKVQTN
jgi:small subunit ribosomal protein S1